MNPRYNARRVLVHSEYMRLQQHNRTQAEAEKEAAARVQTARVVAVAAAEMQPGVEAEDEECMMRWRCVIYRCWSPRNASVFSSYMRCVRARVYDPEEVMQCRGVRGSAAREA